MNRFYRTIMPLAVFLALITLLTRAIADPFNSFSVVGYDQWDRKTKSVKALRNHQVARQQYTFDCAAASLTTLLNYQYGEHYLTRNITNALIYNVEPKKRALIKTNGFSLYEVAKVSDQLGYTTFGYTLDDLNELKSLNFPSIVRIASEGIPHFVVVKQIKNGRVFLADPAWGNRSMTRYQFSKIWQRQYAFFVLPKNKKLGDSTLKNALLIKTPVAKPMLDIEQAPPNLWPQQDIDRFIVNTTPLSLAK